MRFKRPKLLESFRRPGRCDCCGRLCSMLCGAHLFAKGNGGSDALCNLMATAMSPFTGCPCHHDHHATGTPTHQDFLLAVAERENTTVEAIVDTNTLLRQLPKNPAPHDISLRLCELEGESFALASRTLKELGLATDG